MPPKRKVAGAVVPAEQLLSQMEKMNDMLNAENKMMEDKISDMNKDNVEWMRKHSEVQGEVQALEQQHEEALTLLVSDKQEAEARLQRKDAEFERFKQQCLVAAKQSVDIVRQDKQADVDAIEKQLEDASEALEKAENEVRELKHERMKLKSNKSDGTKTEEAKAILEMLSVKEGTVRVLLNSLAAKQHSLKMFETELKEKEKELNSKKSEKVHALEEMVEDKEATIQSLLHRMEIDREVEQKEKEVFVGMKEALEKAEQKVRERDGDLADFEEEISKLLTANNEYEKELKNAKVSLTELSKKSEPPSKLKQLLEQMEKDKHMIEQKLEETERRAIDRQAIATGKFNTEKNALKDTLKESGEEKSRLEGRLKEMGEILKKTLAKLKSNEEELSKTSGNGKEEELMGKLANKENEVNGLTLKLDEKVAETFGTKLLFENKLEDKDAEIEDMKKKYESKIQSLNKKILNESLNKKEEESEQIMTLQQEVSEKEEIVQSLNEKVKKYRRYEIDNKEKVELLENKFKRKVDEQVKLNESKLDKLKEQLAKKEKETEQIKLKFEGLKEKARTSRQEETRNEDLENQVNEKVEEIKQVTLKYENMKEKARKYKSEGNYGKTDSDQMEAKLKDKETEIIKLTTELNEKDGILIDVVKKSKKTETELAGQHSLQIASFQTECGTLKNQLNDKDKEVNDLAEKIKEKEVENDDEIYLLKKEIKALKEDKTCPKKHSNDEEIGLLKKAKRRERESDKYIKKLEEKVIRYKMVIKESTKRKQDEDAKYDKSFKIPKMSKESKDTEKFKEIEKEDVNASLLQLVERAKEWTEKASKAKPSPKQEVDNIPLPKELLNTSDHGIGDKAELEEQGVCERFTQGECPQEGSTCRGLHPKECPRYLSSGTKVGEGCAAPCSYYHPPMCTSSLGSLVCHLPRCTLRHPRRCRRAQDTSSTSRRPGGARGEVRDPRSRGYRGSTSYPSPYHSRGASPSPYQESPSPPANYLNKYYSMLSRAGQARASMGPVYTDSPWQHQAQEYNPYTR